MNNYKKAVIVSVITALIVVVLCFWLHYFYFERYIYLDFEYVTTIDVSKNPPKNHHFHGYQLLTNNIIHFGTRSFWSNSMVKIS